MIRVHIICEGQTEEAFVKKVLSPHFEAIQIYLTPSLVGKPGHKGGNIKFDRLFPDIRNRLHDKTAYCTTFFDFYALPTDFPGKEEATNKAHIKDKAECIQTGLSNSLEAKLENTVAVHRFISYVQMYEFEALLFSHPQKFAESIGHPTLSDFQKIRDTFNSAEEINDSPLTAPSKRIEKLVTRYEKPLQGVLAALAIGLPTIRQECTLFDAWLTKLETLPSLP